MRGRTALAFLLWVILAASAAARADSAYVGRQVQVYAYDRTPAVQMPTAVALGPDGGVWLADGVNDRLLRFNSDGSFAGEVRRLGDAALARPLSLRVDSRGRLWIADTGNHRVVVGTPDGALERVIDLPAVGQHAPDLTDLAVTPDAQQLWLVDNDSHQLVRIDLSSGQRSTFGQRGEGLGQLHYPFALALAPSGDVLVSDVLNGRVQVFDPQGRAVAALGAYGVERGQLYRPKGVAVDGRGAVWVADSVLGVVQVFAPGGGAIDVLRDESGRPLPFETPIGLAFDSGGDLYVVELAANRVRRLAITVSPVRPPERRPARAAEQARACTVCHLEWMPPFADGRDSELRPAPQSTPDDPAVSRAETCLSCHDGSVVDSRRRVWSEHGHRTGVKPLESMHVPPNLPLINGRIACRTCHSAHATGQPEGDMAQAVFLRMPNTASELCVTCHADKTRGPEFGTHPTGGMPWPVPQALRDAGAKVGPNPRELTCQVCHTPHGTRFEHLLVMGASSNQLCLNCHDQMRPGMFREGAHTEHPLQPHANAEQAAAVERLGTRLGPEGQLICLSCHKLHHGRGERYMLADDLTDGRLCLQCHEDRRSLFGTPHDLRLKFPQEKNRLGMTAESAGPCSACHLFHRYARPPEPTPVDPIGLCVTCHQPGRCAESRTLGPLNHPQAKCTDCHNPHETTFGKFLAARPAQVCAKCHADHLSLAGGPHDVTVGAAPVTGRSDRAMTGPARIPPNWPPAARQADDQCLACHRPHAEAGGSLFRVAAADLDGSADASCAACHAGSAWDGAGEQTALHPRDATKIAVAHGLPLTSQPTGEPQIGCKTCHDPHRGADTPWLLRTQTGSPSDVCANCHTEAQHIQLTAHSAGNLAAAGFQADACQPCHRLHASPASVQSALLWPKSLSAGDGVQSAAGSVADHYCTSCHRVGGPAAPPEIATHAPIPLFNPTRAEQPGFLPLFDQLGQVDPRGQISCRTCHLPHGRDVDLPAVAASTDATPAGTTPLRADPAPEPTPAERRARRAQLRPFSPPNVCTSCHGFDGLLRFLYFHDPQRRGGPLEASAGTLAPRDRDSSSR